MERLSAVSTHEDAVGVRAKSDAPRSADELEPGRAAGNRTCISDVVPSAASDKGQTHGSPG